MSDDTKPSEWNREGSAQLKLQIAPLHGESLEVLGPQAARIALELLPEAEGSSVTRLEGDSIVYIATDGTATGLLGRRSSLVNSFTGHVIAGGRGQIFDPNDHHKTPDASRERAKTDAIRSGMIIPIAVSGLIHGTLGVVSRTPKAFDATSLNVLNALASHISRKLAQGRSSAEIDRVHRRHTRMQRISDDFDVSDIRRSVERVRGRTPARGTRTPTPSSGIDPHKELERAIAYAESRIHEVARFEVEIDTDLPHLDLPPGELWQSVLNLLINAAQAIPPGQPEAHRIQLVAHHNPRELTLRVSDTGSGIEPRVRKRIFDPFFSTHGSTGMGLAVVAGFANTSGGSIEVSSQPGRGATFTLKLPLISESTS